jgi:mono/diheme cytochrome c family protein
MTNYRINTSSRRFSFVACRWLAAAAFAATAFSTNAAGAGGETFKAKCAGCHGPDGSGNTAMGKKFKLQDLRSADVQKQSDDDLQGIITKGKPPMPAFGKTLEAAQVTELVAYIRSIAAK